VFAANPDLEIGACGAAFLDAHLDQLPDAFLIERLERVVREDVLLDVEGQEAARIIAAQAHRRLRQVVGAEAKELSNLSEAVRG